MHRITGSPAEDHRRVGERGAPLAGCVGFVTSCPACGVELAVGVLETAVRCGYCQSSHLVLCESGLGVLFVPDRTTGLESAAAAFLEDERRRRSIRLAGSSEGEEEVMEASLESWAKEVAAGSMPLSDLAFFAPYWHVTGRAYEGRVAASPDGAKCVRAQTRGLEVSCPAFADTLPVPEMGQLSSLRDLQLEQPTGSVTRAFLPVTVPRSALGLRVEAALSASFARDSSAIVRDSRFWAGERLLIYRAFHLLELECRGETLRILVDGAARSVAAILTREEAAAIRAAVRETREDGIRPSSGIKFRKMKCPDCGGPLPLERSSRIPFCPSCGRAWRLLAGALVAVRYRAEVPPARRRAALGYLPFWRFTFALTDPEDGTEITSLPALIKRLGGRMRAASGGPVAASGDWLDVPAFRMLERAQAFPITQDVFAPGDAVSHELVEGPVRQEMGLPRPSRSICLEEVEASVVARFSLLLRLGVADLLRASPALIRSLLFDGPLRVGEPALILRAFPKGRLTAADRL